MENNTLTVYQKKLGYQYFFIKKEHQPLFESLDTFALVCSDGTHYENLIIRKSGKHLRYFMFANDFFKEHPLLQKSQKIPFSVDRDKRIVRITL